MSTHRSRWNDSTAAALVVGSRRRSMIVSLRSPMFSRFDTAPAYGESGSMQALLSLPVMRKFIAVGSGSGNVSGGAVLAVGAVVAGESLPGGAWVVVVVAAVGRADPVGASGVGARGGAANDPPARL